MLDLRNLDDGDFQRSVRSSDGSVSEHFRWWSLGVAAHLRAHLDASQSLRFFAQLGIGPGMAVSSFDDYRQVRFGPLLAGAAGLFYMPFGMFGFVAQAGYSSAPLLRNELDEAHNSGGFSLSVGLRRRTWSQP